GRGELDVAHALAAHLRPRDFHTAALADDALEPDALVLAAVALPVLRRTEDLLAEESVLLRLERAVVDGLGLLDLAVRPHADRIRCGQADAKLIEVVYVEQVSSLFLETISAPALVLFVGATLRTGEVDAELFGGAEDVFVEFPHLDLLARGREDLDVQAEGLHLLDEDLEGLGEARLGDVLALHDGLVDVPAAEHVVGPGGE